MTLLGRIASGLAARVRPVERDADAGRELAGHEVLADLRAAQRRIAEMQAHIIVLERHKAEFFDLIVRMERQRDEWRDIHRDSTGKYHEGLLMMESALRTERVRNARLLVRLNAYREAEGKEPITTPRYLDRELGVDATPIGRAKQYAEDVATLEREGNAEHRKRRQGADRPEDIDGAAARSELAERHRSEQP